jgi:hypothetical protein
MLNSGSLQDIMLPLALIVAHAVVSSHAMLSSGQRA